MMFGAAIAIIIAAGAIAFGKKSWEIVKGEEKDERRR